VKLAEVLAGALIGAILLWAVLAFADRAIASGQGLNARMQASTGAAHLVERLGSEASSALAVYVPASDVFGNGNADGHEVDFYAQDGSHRPYLWAYTYDASASSVTCYAIAIGSAPIAGEVVSGIDAFTATAVVANDLSNAASNAYDPLFAGANAPDVPYAFPGELAATGGNRLVALSLRASGVNRRIMLASADAPTAFTVVVTYTPSPAPAITATPAPLVMGTQ
jgi:hypothetical protein